MHFFRVGESDLNFSISVYIVVEKLGVEVECLCFPFEVKILVFELRNFVVDYFLKIDDFVVSRDSDGFQFCFTVNFVIDSEFDHFFVEGGNLEVDGETILVVGYFFAVIDLDSEYEFKKYNFGFVFFFEVIFSFLEEPGEGFFFEFSFRYF